MVEDDKWARGKIASEIGGMSCSFCTESIQKAIRKMNGVSKANVSLSHEEALIQFDPKQVTPDEIKETLISLGYNFFYLEHIGDV
jgi:Cu+-exporting ATPase